MTTSRLIDEKPCVVAPVASIHPSPSEANCAKATTYVFLAELKDRSLTIRHGHRERVHSNANHAKQRSERQKLSGEFSKALSMNTPTKLYALIAGTPSEIAGKCRKANTIVLIAKSLSKMSAQCKRHIRNRKDEGKRAMNTNSLGETPEAKKMRLLEQNLSFLESKAIEGREALRLVLAFISGIRFSTHTPTH